MSLCSVDEKGLYDHVVSNDNIEQAFAELEQIAKRALDGEIGFVKLSDTPDRQQAGHCLT